MIHKHKHIYRLPGLLCAFLMPMLLQAQIANIWVPAAEAGASRSGREALWASLEACPLKLKSQKVDVVIQDQVSKTELEQVWHNPSARRIEGYLLFPVPKGGVLRGFTMEINGQKTEAEHLAAADAKKIYEDIVRSMKDPALLEYYEQNLYKIRIFPINARSDVKISFRYTESLMVNNGTREYRLPLRAQKLLENSGGDFSFRARINSNEDLKTVYSPTHELEINRSGSRNAMAGFEGPLNTETGNLRLFYSTSNSLAGMAMYCYSEDLDEADGFFQASISPGYVEDDVLVSKNVTFVLDASGSMAGEKMDQAKKALRFCIENLDEGDCFNIIRFSTGTQALFANSTPADAGNKAKARAYIQKLKPIGGTNIDEALQMALSQQSPSGEPHMIVFLTDGKPTIGETNTERLLGKVKQSNSSHTRIFTFGIGTKLNTHLLDKITAETRAFRSYVLPDEDIEVEVSDFFTKVSSPVLTNVKIAVDGPVRIGDMFMGAHADLFRGQTLNVIGRYKGSGVAKVRITGMLNGIRKTWVHTYDFPKRSTEYSFIPPLWASRMVGYYLDQIRLNGENEELKGEVIRLAKEHGIITPYTSFLILEDERRNVALGNERLENQILNNRVQRDAGFFRRNSIQFQNGMAATEGWQSVNASKRNQELNVASNIMHLRTSADSLGYMAADGSQQQLNGGIRNIQGRAFYQNGNQWMDARIAVNGTIANGGQVRRVRFNSPEYFNLLRNNRGANKAMSLGRNVRFEMQGEVIEVF